MGFYLLVHTHRERQTDIHTGASESVESVCRVLAGVVVAVVHIHTPPHPYTPQHPHPNSVVPYIVLIDLRCEVFPISRLPTLEYALVL